MTNALVNLGQEKKRAEVRVRKMCFGVTFNAEVVFVKPLSEMTILSNNQPPVFF